MGTETAKWISRFKADPEGTLKEVWSMERGMRRNSLIRILKTNLQGPLKEYFLTAIHDLIVQESRR